MPKTASVKTAVKDCILANDGDVDLQAASVLCTFAFIFDALGKDPEIEKTHRKLLTEIAKGLREDAYL